MTQPRHATNISNINENGDPTLFVLALKAVLDCLLTPVAKMSRLLLANNLYTEPDDGRLNYRNTFSGGYLDRHADTDNTPKKR